MMMTMTTLLCMYLRYACADEQMYDVPVLCNAELASIFWFFNESLDMISQMVVRFYAIDDSDKNHLLIDP